MNYEIVELKEKKVVGVSGVTSNNDPNMGKVIGGLWEKLYKDNIILEINNKVNDYAIGLYSDYEGENYTVTVGCEVSKVNNDDLVTKVIPAGKYAKFTVQGNMIIAVANAWEEIWKLNLDRSFTGDFEEYLSNDCENGIINLYIALKK